MKKLFIFLITGLMLLSCASIRMTPEEKKMQGRIELYKLYLNYGIRDKTLTEEEVRKLDELKKKYGAFEVVIWQ